MSLFSLLQELIWVLRWKDDLLPAGSCLEEVFSLYSTDFPFPFCGFRVSFFFFFSSFFLPDSSRPFPHGLSSVQLSQAEVTDPIVLFPKYFSFFFLVVSTMIGQSNSLPNLTERFADRRRLPSFFTHPNRLSLFFPPEEVGGFLPSFFFRHLFFFFLFTMRPSSPHRQKNCLLPCPFPLVAEIAW